MPVGRKMQESELERCWILWTVWKSTQMTFFSDIQLIKHHLAQITFKYTKYHLAYFNNKRFHYYKRNDNLVCKLTSVHSVWLTLIPSLSQTSFYCARTLMHRYWKNTLYENWKWKNIENNTPIVPEQDELYFIRCTYS